MAKVDACDCCGWTHGVQRVVMDATGVHAPNPRPRDDGFREQTGPDLCAIPGQDFWSCFCKATHDSFDMTVEPDEKYRREHGITHVKHKPAVPTPARAVFKNLWNEINAKRGHGWERNDWLWVYGYRKVQT